MSNLRQAAQQALDALEGLADYRYTERVKQALVALKQALAEPEQAPMHYYRGDEQGNLKRTDIHFEQPEQQPVAHAVVEPLRPDEYQCRVSVKWVGQPVSGPLYTAPTPQPEQEPIGTAGELFTNSALERLDLRPSTAVYIGAPTPRRPLTDEELEPLLDAVDSYDITQYDLVKFARAIERAHGIGGSHE